MKKKYAMVAINKKEEKDGTHIRRVLITYLFKLRRKNIVTYYGTKFIAADLYFSKSKATHKYTFTDKYYKLTDVIDDGTGMAFVYSFNPEIFEKRRYHSSIELAKEFTTSSKQVAMRRFKRRRELK